MLLLSPTLLLRGFPKFFSGGSGPNKLAQVRLAASAAAQVRPGRSPWMTCDKCRKFSSSELSSQVRGVMTPNASATGQGLTKQTQVSLAASAAAQVHPRMKSLDD